jgi:hypothetical protein
MERVRQATVVREWLRREAANPATAFDDDPGSMTEHHAVAALLALKPGASRFIVASPTLRWYRTTLDARAVRALRLIACAEQTLWQALAPDRTVGGAADRIAENDPDRLAAETGVDIAYIQSLASTADATDPLVVQTRRGRTPWTVADGNHRAVARVVAPVRPFEPQPVYLAVRPNPVVGPLRERLAGAVRRLLGRPAGPR